MKVQLVDAGGTDYCVVVNCKLVLVDTSDGSNNLWPARKVAEALAGALGCEVETMAWTPASNAWTHQDLLADLQELARRMGGKKK